MRNVNLKSSSLSQLTMSLNDAIMVFNDLPADREANSGTRILCLSMQTLKQSEDLLIEFGFKTNSVIRYDEMAIFFFRIELDMLKFLSTFNFACYDDP